MGFIRNFLGLASDEPKKYEQQTVREEAERREHEAQVRRELENPKTQGYYDPDPAPAPSTDDKWVRRDGKWERNDMVADPKAGAPVVTVTTPAPARPPVLRVAAQGLSRVPLLNSVHEAAARRQVRQLLDADQRPELSTSTPADRREGIRLVMEAGQ